MAWKASTFVSNYKQRGYAMFGGKFGTYPSSREASHIVKTYDDIMLIENMMKKKDSGQPSIKYDHILDQVSGDL